MPRKKSSLLNDLSTSDLKKLLAARERIDVLEVERTRLMKELAKVEKELGKLMSGSPSTGTGPAKKVRRKKVRKAGKKAGKKVGKKAVRKKASLKKRGSRKAPRTSTRSVPKKLKLEDVVLAVIRKNRGPVAFQDLKAKIVKGKLFKSKSGNFDNVLRRTLSTSKAVKRVGRGIYDVA